MEFPGGVEGERESIYCIVLELASSVNFCVKLLENWKMNFLLNSFQLRSIVAVGFENLAFLLCRYNVSIMAYGQTGSGKTHTMLGPQSESNFTFSMEDEQGLGIIPRASEEVFRYG